MYAVIRAGGKQYRVAPGDVIKVEKFADTAGAVQFGDGDVLAVSPEAGKIVKPANGSATVTGEILGEGREKKILVFHYKRKKQYKKLQGHRQGFVSVRITEIAFDGKKESAPALPARKVKAKPAAAAEAPVAKAKTAAKPAARKTAAKKTAAKKAPAKKSAKKK